MAETEPIRSPNTPSPDSPEREGAVPFDVRAVEGTGSYPINPTLTFPGGSNPPQPPTLSGGPGEMPESPDLPRIPGYRVFRVVAQGGMGTIFEALHIATNRVVALKVINAGWANDNDFRARFAREATTLAALDHKNIVPVYDAGSWQGLPFLTMRFVAGKTLAHHLSALRRDLPAAGQLLVKVARAVQYLHANNIVHRDLKPLNILISPEGEPLVADFGLVRPIAQDSDLSVTLIPLGTRQYMSPEQTRGGRENYTASCDIWAMGIILYEILSGRRPFDHDDTVVLFHQIRHDPTPPIPPEMNAPPGLESISRKCLQKNPTDRYATAEDVAKDFERWLAGEVISPPPLPPPAPVVVAEPAREPAGEPAPVPRASRRLRFLVGGFVIVLVAVLIAGASAGLLGDRTSKTQDDSTDKTINPPPKSVAERLRAGETVILIGPTGLPVLPSTPVAPFTAKAYVQGKGYCALDSAHHGFVQLLDEDLPLPVRLEAEIDIHPRDHESWAGMFVGLKETTTTVSHKSCLLLQHRIKWNSDDEHTDIIDECRLAVGYWWLGQKIPSFYEHDFKTANSKIKLAESKLPRWHAFTFEIAPDKATAEWVKQKFPPFSGAEMLGAVRDLSARDKSPDPPLAFTPPAYGRGLGICVYNAEALYRNVKLIPLR